MSFSSNVKLEIINQHTNNKHCNVVKIAAIINNCGFICSKFNAEKIYIYTDNSFISKKYFTLLKETFSITGEVSVKTNIKFKKSYYLVVVSSKEDAKKLLNGIGILQGNTCFYKEMEENVIKSMVKSECCKKNYLRISFLINGSLTDPTKNYHLEFVHTSFNVAKATSYILNSYNLNSKIIERKNYFVTYIKEGESIVNFLNIVGAHNSLMDFENIRILKDISNNINRKVNCETANLSKTVNAALKQEEDIKFILETRGNGYLSKQLQEVANLRLLYPDATLKEIGEMLTPVISKSGVNHRLRKISNIAKNLRGDKQ